MGGGAWRKVSDSLVVISQDSAFLVMIPGRKETWGLGGGSVGKNAACCVSLKILSGILKLEMWVPTALVLGNRERQADSGCLLGSQPSRNSPFPV